MRTLNSWLYVLYALILGILALFTGEIVTFVMLGFILLSLNNIYTVLKKMDRNMENCRDG